MKGSILADEVRKLVAGIDNLCNVKADYGDTKKYLGDEWITTTLDQGILAVLCWGPWRNPRPKNLWERVRQRFDSFQCGLHSLTNSQIKELQGLYPYLWEKEWLSNLVDFLRKNHLTFQELCEQAKSAPSDICRASLKMAMAPESNSDKIIECFMRDWLEVPSFPIDSRVREVLLKRYQIPPDSSSIRQCLEQLGLDPRLYARAVYSLADELLDLASDNLGDSTH